MNVLERWAIRNPPEKPNLPHPLCMARRLADDQGADWEGEVEMVRADQLQGAVEAVRAHYDRWVKANGRAMGNMRPADRELWIAVLGPEFGGE